MEDDEQDTAEGDDDTCTTTSVVGAPRDPCGHAEGTVAAYESAAKWVDAALVKLRCTREDLLEQDMEPNNTLCSLVHGQIASWSVEGLSASECGVVCDVAFQDRSPPQLILVKARNWMLRYINTTRANDPRRLSTLPSDWGNRLAGRKGDTRMVNQESRDRRAASGSLYHTRREFAPTHDQLVKMTYCGFTADQRVDADELHAMEAGASIALYLATGARGSELKKMKLQSLGVTLIEDTQSGISFESIQLVAYGTKTKPEHLNSLLPHSHPWLDGVGLLGLSILLRVCTRGSPPFGMEAGVASWGMLGSNVDTLDRRLRDCFAVAGVRRQKGDPVTYIGRGVGTRNLDHAGGSSEGGAVRTGHSSGTARHHYTTMPLRDQLKVAGNCSERPFTPAHQHNDLKPLADAVLDGLFPDLSKEECAIEVRQLAVDALTGDRDRVRTDEQLNDRQRMLRALRTACRTAVCCLAARPRTWKQWRILETETSVWEHANRQEYRLVRRLFTDPTTIGKMNILADAVKRYEADELKMQASRDGHLIAGVVCANVELAVQKAVQDQLAPTITSIQALLQTKISTSLPAEAISSDNVAPPTAPRKKNPRVVQEDVTHFSAWVFCRYYQNASLPPTTVPFAL